MARTPTEAEIRQEAYDTVVRVRGSNDVPAFDYCVEAEIKNIKTRLSLPTPRPHIEEG